MRRISDEILAAETHAETGDLHALTGAKIRQADAGSARFHQILAAIEQNRLGSFVSLLLGKNRLIDDVLFARVASLQLVCAGHGSI